MNRSTSDGGRPTERSFHPYQRLGIASMAAKPLDRHGLLTLLTLASSPSGDQRGTKRKSSVTVNVSTS